MAAVAPRKIVNIFCSEIDKAVQQPGIEPVTCRRDGQTRYQLRYTRSGAAKILQPFNLADGLTG